MAQYTPNIQFIIKKSNRDIYDLDITKITDFPLALTYSIKDVQDPSSSKGSFSKTFSIPATKNNNTILQMLFSDSLYDSFQYIEDYDAQIFIDGLIVLQGKFQIKGTTYNGHPKSYECNVYGENFKWVNALSSLNLCDIDFTAGNFFPNAPATATFGRQAIENTWKFGEAGETISGVQTHIVYPLVNTGKWNYTDGGTAFVSPSDMTPAFYFYNMIKCIFAQQGYTLDSVFFETEWFKRLVSFLPKEDFVNSDSLISDYSFEYQNGTPTEWKTPLNYNDPTSSNNCGAVVGNDWHGQMTDLTLVCPTCDPQGLITTQQLTPNFDVLSPWNFMGASSVALPTLAGWYWGCYGEGNSSFARVPWNRPNPCGGGNQIVGMDWSCVSCDIVNGNSTQSIQLETSTFQTNFLGTYEFNGSMELEMNNAYELNDPVTPFDLSTFYGGGAQSVYTAGTGEGGTTADCISGGQEPDGTFETYKKGMTYVFNVYLIHYKHSTGKYHVVSSQSDRKYNPNNPSSPAYYCDSYPLGNTNLKSTLGFVGVQIDILHANDKVFAYGEVQCEKWEYADATFFGYEKVVGLTQMKYKCNRQYFKGNLTSSLIDGGDISLSQILPCDITQLSWINGLTGLFNLMWESDEVAKTIKVEPRDMFFNPISNAIEWTDKLDESTDQKNEYLYDALKRNLCFTYENDGTDGFVEERNRRKGQKCELGSETLNLGELYINEEQKIGSDFYSPTYMFYDKTISNNNGTYKVPFVPVIHSDYSAIWGATTNADLPQKNNEYSPRILCWYGLQPLNQEDGITNSNIWRWGYDNNSSPYTNETEYPFAGVYSDQVGSLGGTLTINGVAFDAPSLYFENSEINAVSTAPPYDVTSGLYEMFWENNILSLIERPIIKKALFKLTAKDISELDFKKLIHIKGKQSDTYWILNKITDFQAGQNKLTQVELYEFNNVRPSKIKFPYINQGWGHNVTHQWTDHVAELVNHGITKVPNNELITSGNLGVYSPTKIPLINVGVQSDSLPNKVNKFIDNNYFDDGGKLVSNGFLNSSNIGKNNNINVGSISIGNNIKNTKNNQIILGEGNNVNSNLPFAITQNNSTAFAVDTTGMIKEGGGGNVYYEDATTGEFKEIMTGVPIGVPFGLGDRVKNGNFENNSNWGGTNFTIANNTATINVPANNDYSYIRQPIEYIEGDEYTLKVSINGTAGSVWRWQDNGSNTGGLKVGQTRTTLTGSPQTAEFVFKANANSISIITARSGTGGNYNIVVSKIELINNRTQKKHYTRLVIFDQQTTF